MQAVVTELALFLGEKRDSDPAALFNLLASFTREFDQALAEVAKRNVHGLPTEVP